MIEESEQERHRRFFGDVKEEEGTASTESIGEEEEEEEAVTLAVESDDPLTSAIAAIVYEEVQNNTTSALAVAAATHLCAQTGVFDVFTPKKTDNEAAVPPPARTQPREIRIFPQSAPIDISPSPLSKPESTHGLYTQPLPPMMHGCQRAYLVQIESSRILVQQRPAPRAFTDHDARRAVRSIQVLIDLLIDFGVRLDDSSFLDLWVDDQQQKNIKEEDLSSPFAHLLAISFSYSSSSGKDAEGRTKKKQKEHDGTYHQLEDDSETRSLKSRPIEFHFKRT